MGKDMTIEEVEKRIAKIEATKHDPEAAHILEDELYVDVLKYVRSCCDEPIFSMVTKALSTQFIDFPRWYT